MKANFTSQERLENIDDMIWQYLSISFDLLEKIMDMLEQRQGLIGQNNPADHFL